jgi:hypothetical protein
MMANTQLPQDPTNADRIFQDLIAVAMLLRAAERGGLQASPEARMLWHSALDLLDKDIEALRAASQRPETWPQEHGRAA